jgi:hypothetical protein
MPLLHIFDQVASYGNGAITSTSTPSKTPTCVDYDYFFKLTDALLEGKVKRPPAHFQRDYPHHTVFEGQLLYHRSEQSTSAIPVWCAGTQATLVTMS